MAFKDANGKITIDEVAAQRDIANIRASIEHLDVVDRLLTQMIQSASEFSGDTGKAIIDSCSSLQSQIRMMRDYSDRTAISIDSIIKKYEQIDRDLRDIMNSFSQN